MVKVKVTPINKQTDSDIIWWSSGSQGAPYITSFHLLSLNLGRSNRSNWSVHQIHSTSLQQSYWILTILGTQCHPCLLQQTLEEGHIQMASLRFNGKWQERFYLPAWDETCHFKSWMTLHEVDHFFTKALDFLKWNTGLGWLLQTNITVIGNKDQVLIVFWGCYTCSRTFGKHIGCL